MSGDFPEKRRQVQTVGTFLRRLVWGGDLGPVSAEASVEVRELLSDPEPPSTRLTDDASS